MNQPKVVLSDEEDICWLKYVPTTIPLKAIAVNRHNLLLS